MTRINEYVGNFTFHPVGHGLFYSGIIKNLETENQFSFIYDCGGENKEKVIDAISNSNLPEEIDLLIISHFHADHIKGVTELKKNHKIKKVVLPYLDETSKIIYIANLKDEADREMNDELIRFIKNSQTFFGEGTEVFYISEESENTNRQEEINNNLDNEFDFFWSNYREKKESEKVENEKGKYIFIGNPIYKSSIWTFIFFMPKKSSDFKELEIFFNEEKITCDNAIDQWDKIIRKMVELKLNNNVSNLICAHGPTNILNIKNIRINKFFYPYFFFLHRFYFDEVGFQFLTGDAEIDNQESFLEKYKDYLNKSILFQIPHHGSKINWHDWFSNYQPFCYLWPLTHNSNHKYKNGIFPSATFSYIAPYSVTEIESTKLGIQMFFFGEHPKTNKKETN